MKAAILLPLMMIASAVTPTPTPVSAATGPPTLPGHRLLVNQPGLRVYSPAQRVGVLCPQLLPLPAHPLATVKRAITLAMPAFETQLKLNGRDPIVKVRPAARSGFTYLAGGCGRTAWTRSIVAFIRQPHVDLQRQSLPTHLRRRARGPRLGVVGIYPLRINLRDGRRLPT